MPDAAAFAPSRFEPTPCREPSFRVISASGHVEVHGGDTPAFTVRLSAGADWMRLMSGDAYRLATAFVSGVFDVDGDIVAAVGWWRKRRRHAWWEPALPLVGMLFPESWFQTRSRAERNIRFHYDRSNAFYQLFLDPRLVYSCAYFTRPERPLDEAQLAKLDHICRKLDLHAGDRFLDIGCGWGALVCHAASRYGARAIGCTLSREQHAYALSAVQQEKLGDRVAVYDRDYRELSATFDKIASVGMFEHVGRRRLPDYFSRVAAMLAPDGLFLNHGIVRAEGIRDDAATLFVRRHVFPGGELAHLSEVLRAAGAAGLDVLDVENLRPHYAMTCARWVARLESNADACVALVGPRTYRTWRLYLAASSAAFASGELDLCQVLFARRGARRHHPLTREYMYRTLHDRRAG